MSTQFEIKEAIEQLESIKDHCNSMIDEKEGDGCIWKADCEALETAIDVLKDALWIPVEERLPENPEENVLIQANGKPTSNITLENALLMATYSPDEGWILENYPEWENVEVVAWKPLPEPYTGEDDGIDEILEDL